MFKKKKVNYTPILINKHNHIKNKLTYIIKAI